NGNLRQACGARQMSARAGRVEEPVARGQAYVEAALRLERRELEWRVRLVRDRRALCRARDEAEDGKHAGRENDEAVPVHGSSRRLRAARGALFSGIASSSVHGWTKRCR